MLKWFIRRRLAAFEKQFGYDITYGKAILDADTSAFLQFAKLQGMSKYRRDVPLDVYCAVKLIGAMHEDCGPCTQLNVAMALAQGVAPETIANVVAGRDHLLGEDVRLGVRFARAALAHDVAAAEPRDAIVAKWGERALVSLAFALAVAKMYPTVKYAMGYGKACSRIVVAGEAIVAHRELAPAAVAAAAMS